MDVKFSRTGLYPGGEKSKISQDVDIGINMIFEMGTLYGPNIILRMFG